MGKPTKSAREVLRRPAALTKEHVSVELHGTDVRIFVNGQPVMTMNPESAIKLSAWLMRRAREAIAYQRNAIQVSPLVADMRKATRTKR